MLRPCTKKDLSRLQQYSLHKEQLAFTKLPIESMMNCLSDSSRHPIVLDEDGKIVSFFVLHEKEGVAPYSSDDCSLLLRSFSTDAMYQRKGYAKKIFQVLPTYLMGNFPHIKVIYLTVTSSNTSAITLYKKVGFVDTGIRENGRSGEMYVMKWDVF
ncbi:GNAT family N-acetyltransferase [Rummeliibacillus sp. JY-2-4R]